MSAECHTCGFDLPFDGACVVCALRARLAEVEGALKQIIRVLGPDPGCGSCCEGCSAEIGEALYLARAALAPPALQATPFFPVTERDDPKGEGQP